MIEPRSLTQLTDDCINSFNANDQLRAYFAKGDPTVRKNLLRAWALGKHDISDNTTGQRGTADQATVEHFVDAVMPTATQRIAA